MVPEIIFGTCHNSIAYIPLSQGAVRPCFFMPFIQHTAASCVKC